MTSKLIISSTNNKFNILKMKKEYTPINSFIHTSSNSIARLKKYKILLTNINNNINSKNGTIETGKIILNEPSYIYNIDEDNDKSIVNKEYVDTHGGGIDKTKPLHLKGTPSLTTTGNIIAGYNEEDETQNKLIINSSNGNVLTQGTIISNSLEIQTGTIETVNNTDNSIINKKYYYDNMTGFDPSKTLNLKGEPSLTTTGNIIISNNLSSSENNKIIIESNTGNITTLGYITANNLQIENGNIINQPLTENNIVNKKYVDENCILLNDTTEQNISTPLNLQNNVKLNKLYIPINNY